MGGYKFPSWLKIGSPNREFKGDYGWDYEGHLRDVQNYLPKVNIPEVSVAKPLIPQPTLQTKPGIDPNSMPSVMSKQSKALNPVNPRSILEQIKNPVKQEPKKINTILDDIHRQTGADQVPHIKVEENYKAPEPGYAKSILLGLGKGINSTLSGIAKFGMMQDHTFDKLYDGIEESKAKAANLEKYGKVEEAAKLRQQISDLEKSLPDYLRKTRDALDKNVNWYDEKLESTTGLKRGLADMTGALPQMAAGIVNPALFAISATGGYANQAEREGANREQQALYGMIGGGTEYLTEKLPFGMLKKTAAGKYINKEASTLIGKYGKQMIRTAGGAAAEAAQEAGSSVAMQGAKKGIYDSSVPMTDQVDANGNLIPGVFSKSNLKGDVAGGAGLYLLMSALGLGVNKLNRPNSQMPNKSMNFAEQSKINPVTMNEAITPVGQKETTQNKPGSIMEQTQPKVEEISTVKAADILNNLKPKAPKIDVMTHDFSKVEDVGILENSIKELEENVKNTPDTPENKHKMLLMNLQLFAAKSKLKKLSKFKNNTLERSLDLTDQEKNMIPDYEFDYIPETSKEWADKAAENVENDLEGTMRKIENSKSISGGTEAHEAAIISMKLKEEAMQTGDYSKFKKFLRTVATKTRETARALKGTDTAWNKKTADGAIMDAQRAVDNAEEEIKKKNPKLIEKVNKETKSLIDKIRKEDGTVDAEAIRDRVKKDYGIPVLTDEDIKSIQDHMDKAQTLPEDSYEQRVEHAKVSQIISDKQLVSGSERWQAVQRVSMLLNPKTLLTRNPMGNIILGAAENLKDIPGAAIDKIVSLGTGKRTTGLPEYLIARKGQGKGFVKGAKEWGKDIKNGVDTSPSLGQMELPHKRIFKKNKLLNSLEQITSRGLQLGDRPFYQAAYDARLQELMKLNKVKVPTQKMIEDATGTALEKTLQNDTTLSKSAKMVQKALNGGRDFGFGNIVMPFTKTPANILDKIIDYSPGGLVKALTETAKIRKGTFNQKKFVDSVSRGLTGTGLIALGYAMAKNGLINGDLDKDKDVANLEKQMGKQAYSFKVGNKHITFDWAQPSSVPLAIGADFYTTGKSKKDVTSAILSGFEGGANTLFKQSFLQGIQRMMSGYSPAAGIASTITNAPNGFIPNGGRQINQLMDPYSREIYNPNGKQQFVNNLKIKIPGMSKSLLPRVDSLGNDSKAFDGNNSIFNVLLNPGYVTTAKSNPEMEMVTDLYNKTGLKSHFPRIVPKKLDYQKDKYSEKITIDLTPQEYYNFQKDVGQKYKQLLQTKASSYDSKISNRFAVDKVSELEKELSKIYNEARMRILKSRGIVK